MGRHNVWGTYYHKYCHCNWIYSLLDNKRHKFLSETLKKSIFRIFPMYNFHTVQISLLVEIFNLIALHINILFIPWFIHIPLIIQPNKQSLLELTKKIINTHIHFAFTEQIVMKSWVRNRKTNTNLCIRKVNCGRHHNFVTTASLSS